MTPKYKTKTIVNWHPNGDISKKLFQGEITRVIATKEKIQYVIGQDVCIIDEAWIIRSYSMRL